MFSIPVFTVEQFALTIFYDKDMYGHKDTHTDRTEQHTIRQTNKGTRQRDIYERSNGCAKASLIEIYRRTNRQTHTLQRDIWLYIVAHRHDEKLGGDISTIARN